MFGYKLKVHLEFSRGRSLPWLWWLPYRENGYKTEEWQDNKEAEKAIINTFP